MCVESGHCIEPPVDTLLKPHIERIDEAVETVGARGELEDLSLVLLRVDADSQRLLAREEGAGGKDSTKLRLHTHLLREVTYRTAMIRTAKSRTALY